MRRFHQFDKLSVDEAADCRGFDVVGVTERELGDSIFDRLVALRTLRSILDSARVNSPIHVFGGLESDFHAVTVCSWWRNIRWPRLASILV